MNKSFFWIGSLVTSGVILLAGCAGATPAAPQPAVTNTVASTAIAEPTTPAPQATLTLTLTPPPSSTDTPMITATPAITPSGPAGKVVIQRPDNSIIFIDALGNTTTSGTSPEQISSAPFASTVANGTVYGLSFNPPARIFVVDTSGVRTLNFGPFVTGLAARPGQYGQPPLLAWGTYTIADTAPSTYLHLGEPNDTQSQVVVTETGSAMLPNLVPVQWSQDGQSLFYSSEPTGLGGYIPFGGLSGLQRYDLTTGLTTTLIPRGQFGMICIDDLANDASMVLHHCDRKVITVLSLSSSQTSTIQPPAELTGAAALGSARFSPNRARVAFALARRNPENEQSWIAVSENLSGQSTRIVTGEPGEYLSVKGWLDNDTIVFQRIPVTSADSTSVWVVRADGGGLAQLSEGTALTVITPSTGNTQEPPGGVLSARQLLAQQLHVDLQEVAVTRFEPVEWPNACLGVQTQGLACAEVITPGYRVILEAQGKQYEFHTDQDGGNVILAAASPVEIENVAIEWQSSQDICQAARISAETVAFGFCGGPQIAGKFAHEGRARAFSHYVETFAPFSAQTVAGNIVFTGTGNATATPAEQRMIAEFAQLATMEAAAGRSGASYGIVMAWHREGGIAGFCEDITVSVLGEVNATSCKGGTPQDLGVKWLSATQVKQLFEWVDRLKSFDIDQTDPAVADAMTIRMFFGGAGTAEPTDADKQAIQDFTQRLLGEFSQ
ncbi:MAG: hypothetical protein M1546_10045 [Chloroflexi bacterium]|nr:hypothetical protein [Chloroflexota bacterium]